jgi:NAD(P)-dependent dehydrogenase (short-subunit alcohol dehydrogenase family)
MTESVVDAGPERVGGARLDLVEIFRLDGKVAIVTGASYGLGVLFSEILATAGADVVVTARSVDKLEVTKALVGGLGRRCLAIPGDVTSYDDCERVVQRTMEEFGHIDVLVNNAGWADDRLVRTERCEPEMFARMVNTDLVGVFNVTRAAAPAMLRGGGGSIINLSSIFGNAGAENRTAGYFAAKGGVNQLTKLLACEWGDRNLRVNALAPNFFVSEMTRTLLEDSGMADWMRSRTPMRRMGELPELIGPFLFLASDASSFVTGTVLNVDGGWSASGGYAQNPQPWDDWNGEMGTPITTERPS